MYGFDTSLTTLLSSVCVCVCDRVQALRQSVMNAANASITWKRLQRISTSITRRAFAAATAIVF